MNRLTTATGPFGSLSYTYDPVGNRLTETQNGQTSSYTYTANKLMSISGPKAASFQFDANGNTMTENARQFTYDSNSRLIKAAEGAATLGEYRYDGSGRRTIKKVGAGLVDYHYDQSGFLISETTDTGAPITDYVYLNGQPLAKIEGSQVYYIHPDHLGTPVLMTDSVGTKIWEIENMPFGDGTNIAGTATLNLRFPGQ
ncbi:MAG: RHS repeat protein [Nitrospirae bacterium]|nr:RHS repeat protein [Nitrospirota bacterium]